MSEALRWILNLPPAASSVARDIDALHFSVIGVTFAGVFACALATIYFVIKYRRRGVTRPTPRIVAPGWLEGGLIAGLLALFVSWWVIGFLQYRRLQIAPADAIPVYVTAKQWMWKFGYPSGPIATDDLVVPVGQPVKLIMESRDVIHSFFVPAFRIKQDVVPGRATTVWFAATQLGSFDILCAQYCGTRHSMMRGRVVVLSRDAFARWLDAAAGPKLAERGVTVAAEHGCLRCHSLDGSASIGPSWRGAFGRTRVLADGSRVVIDEAYLTESMMDPNAKVAAGFAPVMPTYMGQLVPADIDAIVELIRSLGDAPLAREQPGPTHPVVMP